MRKAQGYILIAVIGILLVLGGLLSYLLHVYSDVQDYLNVSVQYHRVKEAAKNGLILTEARLKKGEACRDKMIEFSPDLKLSDIHTHVVCHKEGNRVTLESQAFLELKNYPYRIQVKLERVFGSTS